MTQRLGLLPPTNVTGVLFQCNEFVAGQSSCSEGFSPRVLRFSSLDKIQHPQMLEDPHEN